MECLDGDVPTGSKRAPLPLDQVLRSIDDPPTLSRKRTARGVHGLENEKRHADKRARISGLRLAKSISLAPGSCLESFGLPTRSRWTMPRGRSLHIPYSSGQWKAGSRGAPTSSSGYTTVRRWRGEKEFTGKSRRRSGGSLARSRTHSPFNDDAPRASKGRTDLTSPRIRTTFPTEHDGGSVHDCRALRPPVAAPSPPAERPEARLGARPVAGSLAAAGRILSSVRMEPPRIFGPAPSTRKRASRRVGRALSTYGRSVASVATIPGSTAGSSPLPGFPQPLAGGRSFESRLVPRQTVLVYLRTGR